VTVVHINAIQASNCNLNAWIVTHVKDGLKTRRRVDAFWRSRAQVINSWIVILANCTSSYGRNTFDQGYPGKSFKRDDGQWKKIRIHWVLIAAFVAIIRYDMYTTLNSLICSYLVGLGEKLDKLTGREPQNRQFQLVWPIEGGSRCWWRVGRLVREWWENGENRGTAGKWARLSHTRTPRSCKLIVDRYCAFVAHG